MHPSKTQVHWILDKDCQREMEKVATEGEETGWKYAYLQRLQRRLFTTCSKLKGTDNSYLITMLWFMKEKIITEKEDTFLPD